MKIAKGFMPWYCFIFPTGNQKSIRKSNRIYWMGYVFTKEYSRETIPSKLSGLIKRIIQVRTEKQLRKRMQKIPMRTPKDDPEIHRIVSESFWDYF